MQLRRSLFMQLLFGGVGLTLLFACGKSEETAPKRQATPLDLSTTGTIAGVIQFDGVAPEPSIVQLSGWSECAAQHPEGNPKADDVLIHNGKVANALVYVKEGLGDRVFAVPTAPVTLDQKGCIFAPRILGAQTEQPVVMLNSDPLAHNVHGLPKNSSSWNFSLGVKGASRTTTVNKPETMIEIKCDIHPWMRAYLGVFDHPYFALSGADGNFSLKNLPPGEYTLEAWHERFGTQSQKVTLGPKETKEIVFTFKAS